MYVWQTVLRSVVEIVGLSLFMMYAQLFKVLWTKVKLSETKF